MAIYPEIDYGVQVHLLINPLYVTTPDSHPTDRERASLTHAKDFAAPRHLSRQKAPDSPT